MKADYIRVNRQIRARELRVIGDNGDNYGILSLEEALRKAIELELDLVEISPNAKPPVAKITDYGKFLYDEKKKTKAAKQKAHLVEVKNIQVKVGTGDHDLALKARRIDEWLGEGHRIKLDLFLPGRLKYMKPEFLEDRLKRVLALVTIPYNIAEKPAKSPKGLTTILERGKDK